MEGWKATPDGVVTIAAYRDNQTTTAPQLEGQILFPDSTTRQLPYINISTTSIEVLCLFWLIQPEFRPVYLAWF